MVHGDGGGEDLAIHISLGAIRKLKKRVNFHKLTSSLSFRIIFVFHIFAFPCSAKSFAIASLVFFLLFFLLVVFSG